MRLINQCEDMEYTTARLAAALHIKMCADQNGDPWCRIVACYLVAWAYLMVDDEAKAFPYCAEFFQLIEQYPSHCLAPLFVLSLASQSIYVASCLPQIPKEQCKALLDQFEALSKRYNMEKRAYHQAASRYYWTMGQLEEAARSFERFRMAAPGSLDECLSCRVAGEVSALICLSRRAEALQLAEPLLNGTLNCAHGCQPRDILSELLEDDLEQNEMEAAAVRAAKLSRMGFKNRSDFNALNMVLLYRARANQNISLRLLEKAITWSVGLWDLSVLFDFYLASWAICAVVAKEQEQIHLKLPKKFALYQEDGLYQPLVLADWFYKKAEATGQKFDQRNGTNRYAENINRTRKGLHLL